MSTPVANAASTSPSFLVGVDIGGSGVKVGIVNTEGTVLARAHENFAGAEDRTPERVVGLAVTLMDRLLGELHKTRADVAAAGVCCPGVLVDGGVIRAAANFPAWKDVPLRALFVGQVPFSVQCCNDADAAILAEHWVGSAKADIHSFIMLTLGTGVGFGLIVDGKLVRGGTDAIEGGHLIVERNGRLCGCTQRGCLEAYSSAGALVLEAQEHLSAGADSKLSTFPIQEIDAKRIFQTAAEGDAMCIRLIEEAADYLGFACVSFCRILDPQMIVLSGGMAEAGATFLDLVRAAYDKYTWNRFPNPVKIEKASAGYDSGIIGAAAIAR